MAEKDPKKIAKDVTKSLVDNTADAKNIAAEFIKELSKGGKQAKAIFDQIKKQVSGIADQTNIATDALNDYNTKAKDNVKDSSKLQEIQKKLSTYDGPRFKAAGLITKELSNQLSASKFIIDSKNRINELEENSKNNTELLNDNLSYSNELYQRIEDAEQTRISSSQRSLDLSKEIVNTENALEQSKIQLVSANDKLSKLAKKQIDLQKESFNLQTKEKDLTNEIQKLDAKADPEKRNKLEQELVNVKKSQVDLETKLSLASKLEESALISRNSLYKQSLNLEEKLSDQKQEESTLNNLLVTKEKELSELRAEQAREKPMDVLKQKIQGSQMLRNVMESINDINNDQINAQGSLADSMIKVNDAAQLVGTSQYYQVNLQDDINDKIAEGRKLQEARLAILDENNGLTGNERTLLLGNLDANIKINESQLKQLQALQASSEAYDTVNDKAEALRDSMMAPIDKLFGIVPSGLSKQLGLDKIQSELKDKLFKSIADGFMSAGGGVSGFFSAAISGAGTLITTLAPILPLLLAIAGVVGLVKLFMNADAAVGALAKDLNISYKEAIKVQGVATDIATDLNMAGVNTEEVTKQMSELQKATGVNLGKLSLTNETAKKLVETSTMLTAQYGMTADETMQLNTAAAITGTSMEKMALMAEKFGADGLVPAQDILKDMGKVSKSILVNFKGDSVALARAVKQAKLMGTTLDKINSAGEKLMDIESSVTAENKARLMLGRDINMNAARYYAMTGQTEQLMQEMKKQAGSVADYERMGPMQRKILAEALGMSNDELADMMSKQKELETMGISEQKLNEILKKDTENKLDLEAELAGMKDDQARAALRQKVEEQRRASIQEKLMGTLHKIQAALYKAIEPLLPMIDSFVDSLGDGKGLIDTMSGIFKTIGSVLSTIFKVGGAFVKGVLKPMSFIFGIIGGIVSAIGDGIHWIAKNLFGVSDAAESTSGSMKTIEMIAQSIGVIIGLWFAKVAIQKVVGGFTSMAKGIKGAYDTTKDMGKNLIDSAKGFKDGIKDATKEGGGFFSKLKGGIKGLFKKKSPVEEVSEKGSDAAEKIKAPEVDTKGADESVKKTKSFADRLNSMFKSINDTLKSIYKGVGDMLKNTFNFIKDTVKTITKFITDTLSDLLNAVKKIGKDVASAFKSLLKDVQGVLNTAVDVIEDVGTNLISAVEKLLVKVFKTIKTVGKEVISTFNTLLKGIQKVLLKAVKVVKNVGKEIINTFGELIQGVADVISGAGVSLVTSIGDLVGAIIDVLSNQGTALVNMLGDIGSAVVENVFKIVNTLLDGLGEAAGKLPGILNSLGQAVGSFFEGLGAGLLAFGEMMATPTPFGVPVGLIVVGMALGLATAARIAAPAISALGTMFGGLAKVIGSVGIVIESIGKGIAAVVTAVGNTASQFISTVADSLVKLGEVNVLNLLGVASSLGLLAIGIGALTAGSIVGGIADFFGAGPADLLEDLASVDGATLERIAKSIESLATGMGKLASTSIDSVGDGIANLTESLDDLADVDGGDLMDVADAVVKMAAGFTALSASLSKLPGESIAKVKELAKVAGETTGQGLFGSISSSIGGAIESVKTGFSSITGSISNSISSGFSSAYDAVSGWFGQSPSEIGNSIVKGISSVKEGVTDSLTSPFTDAADTVNGTIGGIKDSVSSIPSVIGGQTDVSGLENIQNIDVDKIKNVSEQLRALDIPGIKQTLTDLSEALSVIDWDQLKIFSELANSNLKLAAESLVAGINGLVNINTKIDFGALEDTFDDLEDALDELDFGDLVEFSKLASADLSGAGQHIIDGINSLANVKVPTGLDFSALEDVFDDLEDVISELDLDDLQKFGQININSSGIESLKTSLTTLIGIGDISDGLSDVEDTFDLLEDALSELDLESLQAFSQINATGLTGIATALYDGITALITLGDKSSELSKVEDTFDLLEDALSELDIEQIQQFSNLKLDTFSANITLLGQALDQLPRDLNLSNLNIDALDDVPDIISGLNEVKITDDTFKIFEKLAAIDASKIAQLSTTLSESGTNFIAFKDTLTQLQDIESSADILTSFLEDLTDIDSSEIDSLAVALENLAKSYTDLSSAMANISDADIEKMKSMNDNIGFGSVVGGIMGSISGLFDSEDEETATATATPIMQQTAKVINQPVESKTAETTQSQTNLKNVEQLLKELISKVDQPVVLKIGEKTISDMQSVMSYKKSYLSNVNGYRP